MSEWREVRLDNVLEVKYGKDHKKLQDGLVPCYGTGGIMRYVNDDLYNEESILIPRKGSLNNIYYLDKPFWTVDTLFWTKINKELVSAKFLFYQLTLIDFTILNVGSAVPSLTVPVLNEIDISLPPLPEQKAIAEVLSSLDDKIDLLHRQNKTLEQMAETLFRQWFVEEAGEDWREVTFDDILTVSSSKRIFYKEYVDIGIPFYRSKEIIELSKGGTTSTELFISEERFNEIDSKFGSPKEGDILLTSVGTLGVTYQVRKTDKFYFKDGNLTWFKNFKLLPSSIVYCWLNSSIGKEELDNIAIGSTQAALTISSLKNIELKIPSPEIIEKVDNELKTIYEKLFFNQIQIRTLESLRDTLLPKLMSGEIRVQYSKEAAQ